MGLGLGSGIFCFGSWCVWGFGGRWGVEGGRGRDFEVSALGSGVWGLGFEFELRGQGQGLRVGIWECLWDGWVRLFVGYVWVWVWGWGSGYVDPGVGVRWRWNYVDNKKQLIRLPLGSFAILQDTCLQVHPRVFCTDYPCSTDYPCIEEPVVHEDLDVATRRIELRHGEMPTDEESVDLLYVGLLCISPYIMLADTDGVRGPLRDIRVGDRVWAPRYLIAKYTTEDHKHFGSSEYFLCKVTGVDSGNYIMEAYGSNAELLTEVRWRVPFSAHLNKPELRKWIRILTSTEVLSGLIHFTDI